MWVGVVECKWTVGVVLEMGGCLSDYELVHLAKCVAKVVSGNSTHPHNSK